MENYKVSVGIPTQEVFDEHVIVPKGSIMYCVAAILIYSRDRHSLPQQLLSNLKEKKKKKRTYVLAIFRRTEDMRNRINSKPGKTKEEWI